MFQTHRQELRTLPDGRLPAFRPAGTLSSLRARFSCVRAVDKKLILAGLFIAAPVLAAFGLAVTFPDMVMEQVKPGAVFNSVKDKGIPYMIVNRTDGPIDVAVDFEAPAAKSVKEGYEPAPKPEWFKMVPNRFHLEQGGKASGELVLSVPKDKHLIGHHFQMGIHAHTLDSGFLAVGVLHNVYFSIGVPAPVDAPKEVVPDGKK